MSGKTTFTQDIADSICEAIADGYSLRSICSRDGMPSRITVFKWLNEIEGFSSQYARAREEQAETLADEIISIADNNVNDAFIDENGNVRVNNDEIARSRLRVDTRKWVASKLKPKKYGEKIDIDVDANLNHSGNIAHTVGFESSAQELLNKIR